MNSLLALSVSTVAYMYSPITWSGIIACSLICIIPINTAQDFIGYLTFQELAQGFGLVTPDPFSLCELGGVWVRNCKHVFSFVDD